jgi:hypothetical protein
MTKNVEPPTPAEEIAELRHRLNEAIGLLADENRRLNLTENGERCQRAAAYHLGHALARLVAEAPAEPEGATGLDRVTLDVPRGAVREALDALKNYGSSLTDSTTNLPSPTKKEPTE